MRRCLVAAAFAFIGALLSCAEVFAQQSPAAASTAIHSLQPSKLGVGVGGVNVLGSDSPFSDAIRDQSKGPGGWATGIDKFEIVRPIRRPRKPVVKPTLGVITLFSVTQSLSAEDDDSDEECRKAKEQGFFVLCDKEVQDRRRAAN